MRQGEFMVLRADPDRIRRKATLAMRDLFIAFVLIGMSAALAIIKLRQWILTRRHPHWIIVFAALASELAIHAGFLDALISLVLAMVLRSMVFSPTSNN